MLPARSLACLLWTALAVAVAAVPVPGAAAPSASAAAEPLAAQAPALAAWYAAVGGRQGDASFGQLYARVAAVQLGRPYSTLPESDGESLRYDLSGFNCVTLVEESLALARCVWAGTPEPGCFARELLRNRYRAGRLDGHLSRLHYFEEWLQDNAGRGLLALQTTALGGQTRHLQFNFMSRQPQLYPFLATPAAQASMRAIETSLSRPDLRVLGRTAIPVAQAQLHGWRRPGGGDAPARHVGQPRGHRPGGRAAAPAAAARLEPEPYGAPERRRSGRLHIGAPHRPACWWRGPWRRGNRGAATRLLSPRASALVLLHGFAGGAPSWADTVARCRRSGRRRPVAARPPPGRAGPAGGFAALVANPGQALGPLPEAHLVGYSLGARLALGLLASGWPCRRVSLIGVHPGLEDATARAERAAADAAWQGAPNPGQHGRVRRRLGCAALFASQARARRRRRRPRPSCGGARRPRPWPQALASGSLARMPNFWPELARLPLPVHYLAGADDAKFVALARRAQACQPRATLSLLPDCGHNPLLEAPAALAAPCWPRRQPTTLDGTELIQ